MKRANKNAKSRGIRFASNITPNVAGSKVSSANDIEYVIDEDEQQHTVPNCHQYKLTLNIEDLTNPRRSKKKPPRPQNSFLLFRKDFAVAHRSLHKGVKFFERDISTLAAKKWSEQPASVRIFFRQLELIALKKHKEIYPNYSYKPKKKSLNFQNGDLEGNFETFTPKEIDQCAETTENIINPNPQVVGCDFFQHSFMFYNINFFDPNIAFFDNDINYNFI